MSMSEDEYQHKAFFEERKAITIIGKDVTVTFIPNPLFEDPKKLFCEEIKTNKNDKTI